jgi:ergothioneine biosynthesis protein EgtB
MVIFISKNSLRDYFYNNFTQCRQGTLHLFNGVDDTAFRGQPHADFSPIGWHLGHIAYTEALWLLAQTDHYSSNLPEYNLLFRADGLPKHQRVKLPQFDQIVDYLTTVRSQIWQHLEQYPIEQQHPLWRFILQHESQHGETIAFVRQLQQFQHQPRIVQPSSSYKLPVSPNAYQVEIPAGLFWMGNDTAEAMDNERPLHQRHVETYYIDRYPVTCGQYRIFIQAGGYQNPQWWSTLGWQWLQQNPVTQPLYWTNNPQFDDHPVCGVSYFEAEAYCHFVGKRLPTEAEWEKAASWNPQTQEKYTYPWGETLPNSNFCNCNFGQQDLTNTVLKPQTTPVAAYPQGSSYYGVDDLLGNVWEWTSSVFEPYSGFQYYPYKGYSQTYFDGEHYVLRGGSWATRPWALRNSFRNWYHPGVREILAGFRCVQA